jgi:hypothetical protein
MRTTLEEVFNTEVMTAVRGSDGSRPDTGGISDGRSDAPGDMVIEIATMVTSIDADTAGEDTLQSMERYKNGKRRRCSEVPAAAWALWHWRSRMERTAHQHAHKLAQLHRTVTKMVNMLKTQTPLQEVQW